MKDVLAALRPHERKLAAYIVRRSRDPARAEDILQETLPNVVAAHTMQSYVGGYGSMINPVGACATAAVSIEEGLDKIKAGKADFVVAGAIDDIQVESSKAFPPTGQVTVISAKVTA